jgi:biotin synthase
MLSRISWPVFPTKNVFKAIPKSVRNGAVKRVCIQALNYPEVFTHLQALAKGIKERTEVPLSVSCQPLNSENVRLLADAGTERIGIPLDAATEELFDKIKGASAGGPYSWGKQWELLDKAISVFGKGKVSTHLIVDLGETEEEMIGIIQKCSDLGVLPGLFAFTPIGGTQLEDKASPSIQKYRRVQIARSLILHAMARFEDMYFDEGQLQDFSVDKQMLMHIVQTGEPFLTSGCPDCNRPYYNEKPSGPIYNYPRKLMEKEHTEIRKQLGFDGV